MAVGGVLAAFWGQDRATAPDIATVKVLTETGQLTPAVGFRLL